MICGEWQTCLIDISESAVLSNAVDMVRPWDSLEIEFPTITNAQITVRAARTLTGTYQDLYITDPADGGNNKLISATSTGGITWIVPCEGWQFFKLFSSANQLTADKSFKLRGVRS